jgi:hypothetical protein
LAIRRRLIIAIICSPSIAHKPGPDKTALV